MQRDLTNLYVSESYYRLLQTDPVDDSTLLDGTGSLVTYLAVSGTVDAYYFKGDGSQLTNISPATLPSGVVSSSAQTLKNLSGTNIVSSSAQRSVLELGTTDSPTFNNLTLTGDLTARQLIISSSVISVTQSFSSGSNIFGNSLDDTHQFTGSVYVTGSVYGTFVGDGAGLTNIVALGTISSSQQIQNFGFITSSDWNGLVNKPSGIVSSSVQVLGGTGIISSSTQRSSIGLGTSDNVTFGNISGSGLTLLGNAYIDGTLTARTYVISSSVVDIQSIKASGSTQFGDTIDDTHQFTGSLFLSGSLTSRGTIAAPLFSGSFDGAISSSQQISNLGFITSGEMSGSVYWNNILNKPTGLVSSSIQTIANLSGSNIVSSSGQRSVLGLGESDSPRFATLYATNGNYDGNVVVGGTLTARTYVISSSVVNYETISVSGSTKFGDTVDDTHQFTGSLFVSRFIQAPSFTGSLQGTASYASTASYLLGTITSASYASTASYINPLNQNVIITGSLIQGGEGNITTGEYSHAEGSITKAIGDYSHAEGDNTQAKGNYSHTEGQETIASGSYSHAEGYGTIARGQSSHAEGSSTVASGDYSHTEGASTVASAPYSHAEGGSTVASGDYSHAEGTQTIASGSYSHAEGDSTQAIGISSHAEGESSKTFGNASHAEGLGTIASGDYQHAQGKYNIVSSVQSAFIVGNGTDDTNRSNLIFAAGNKVQITGSLGVTQGITGSLFGTATSASYASTASFLLGTIASASYAISASYLIGGAASSNVKGGYVSAVSFTGTPKIATVTFGSAFSDNNYTVTVTGEDVRLWSVESKTAAGFTINTNSNVALTNSVYWIATTFSS